MKRAVWYLLAWCGATALAVAVSWLGVRDVLRTTVMHDAPLSPIVGLAAAAPSKGARTESPEPATSTRPPSQAPLAESPAPPTPDGTGGAGRTGEPGRPGGTSGTGTGGTGTGGTDAGGTGGAGTSARAPSSSDRSSQSSQASQPPPSSRSVRSPAAARQPAGTPEAAARPSASAAGGETLHTFTLKGGRATVAVTATDCRVVTATPNDGYEVKVWETSSWLRVAFLQGSHESSAFCTWNTLPPRLDTYEN